MNVINRTETPARPTISAEERARREKAVAYARGSVRLEGHVLSDFTEDTYRRFIDGEFSRDELQARMLAHHKL